METIIIGAGQAGLATSYHLAQRGHAHRVFERADAAGTAWRDRRWDSFSLVTPNWAFLMPGACYGGSDPDGFMTRDEVAAVFADYPRRHGLPVQYGVSVDAVETDADGGYRVHANGEIHRVRNVVVATGLFQAPRIPACAAGLPARIVQLHSDAYRNPAQLPPGGVVVVGSAQSGCQIADELLRAGRRVTLCTGAAPRLPRRYRGRDTMEWLARMGVSDQTVDTLTAPKEKFAPNPQMAGRKGAAMNLHRFAREGMQLAGRLLDVRDGRLLLGDDLHANLARGDQFEAGMLAAIDGFIARTGADAPAEALSPLRDGYETEAPQEIELAARDIGSVVWATGHRFDFGFVKAPVFDGDGYPLHVRGQTTFPGLCFVGLPWLHKRKSGLISGVGEDAAFIADRLCAGNAVAHDVASASATASFA